MMPRPIVFAFVGAAGFVVQATVLSLLTSLAHWPVALSTALAVEAAILINFVWHERWTWGDRRALPATRLRRLLRFHWMSGMASIAGSVGLTWVGVHTLGLHLVVANALSVAALAGFNYRAAGRWVFPAVAVPLALLISAPAVSAAQLRDETLHAWWHYVSDVERSLDAAAVEPTREEPQGRTVDVPSGTISEWQGSVLIPNRTVGEVIDILVSSTTLPQSEEVVSSRIMSRQGDALHTYMRLVRRVLVTATYDTEHDVQYTRHSASLATSRSVATRISEVDGGDRGFLWRLNSYWRYRKVGSDVRIDMRSLALSRGTPWMLKPIASPIVNRIGRESVKTALDAIATFLKAAPVTASAERRQK